MKKSKHLTNLVVAALMAAMCCVVTMVIKIPSIVGYLNAGDAVVILAAFLLPPAYAAAAAGIGSALADILGGYAHYAVGTFVIKALMALCAALIMQAISKKASETNKLFLLKTALAAVCAELIMITGYFLYESFILSYGVDNAAILAAINAMQSLVGLIGGIILCGIFNRVLK